MSSRNLRRLLLTLPAFGPALASPSKADEPPVVVVVDADDDDDDGVPDAEEAAAVPMEHLFAPAWPPGTTRVSVEGALRLVEDGRPVASPLRVSSGRLPLVRVQGLRASSAPSDAAIIAETPNGAVRVPVTVVAVSFVDATNALLVSSRDALAVSSRITNDASLPRTAEWNVTSEDPANVRIEIFDPSAPDTITASLVSTASDGDAPRARLDRIPLTRPGPGRPHRSPFVRFVADEMDAEAPGVTDRVLRVGLRDEVRIDYRREPVAVSQAMRVGRPGDEAGPNAARQVRLRVRVLRTEAGGAAVIGADDVSALRVAREQIAIANEVWSQCEIGFGPPESADLELVDPPPPALVSVGDAAGAPARGGGLLRLRVNGRAIRPVRTQPGAKPVDTAIALAGAIEALGFRAEVTENARKEFAAGRSADVLVRARDGRLATLSNEPNEPLSSDARQELAIGRVTPADGIEEFDNMTAASGTLEERTLVKALADDDPRTIDIFVVSRFAQGTRQGEAFIEGDGGAIWNALILDRNGLRQQRQAWTQAHEIGHILLDHPLHPDNVGPDRPWMLMDADNSLGTVTGPKRLTADECARVRALSGDRALPSLLQPADVRTADPVVPGRAYPLGYARDGR